MNDALARGDRAGFLAALAGGPLLLPVAPEAAAGRETIAWPTGTLDGETHVLAFTSPAAIAACLPGRSVAYRIASVTDLSASWPDPSWWLAVDPGLPIGTRLPADLLREISETHAEEREEALREAVRQEDPDAVVAALLRAEIVVPLRPDGSESRDLTDPDFPWWCVPDETGQPTASVFTSETRMRQVLGDVDFVVVNSVQLAESWPDPAWSLAVNPGTPLAAALPGDGLRALGGWVGQLRTVITDAAEEERRRLLAAELAEPMVAASRSDVPDGDGGDDEPDPTVPVLLQLVIPPGYLASYLEQGYDRAAGLVHAWRGPGRESPMRLYRRLGLLGEGSPFAESDEWVAVLRWAPNDETPEEWGSGEPRMESVVVPDGAELHRIHRDGSEEPVARFDAAARRWHPAGA